MLLYNSDGTVTNLIINAIVDGKVTSSIESAPPVIQDTYIASASNARIINATNAGSSSAQALGLGYPTSTNTSNLGYTYKSSVTSVKRYSTASYAVLNPTSADLHTRGQYNYWVTASTTITPAASTIVSASWKDVSFANNGISASISAGAIAKVSVPVSYFSSLFKSSINDSNDVRAFNILSYNGVVSTLTQYNSYSSSIANGVTSSYVVMYVSASKANMGSVVSNPMIVTLGTLQNPTGPTGRIRAIAAAIVDEFPGGGTGAVTFNGVNQYFTAPNAQVTSWLPGTGDFTIEFFVKSGTQKVGAPRIFSLGFDTGATIGISYEGGSIYVWPYGADLVGSTPASFNNGSAWMHVAICRSGTTTKLFLNGELKATKLLDNRNINDSINPGYDLNVGVDNPLAGSPNWFAGKLTNFRWDNSAIYTSSSLIVPTSPLTASATTKLLMLGGGSTNPVYDAAKLNTLVNNGSVWDAETPFV